MILKWNISYIINVVFIAKTVLNASKSMWNIMLISVEVCEEVVTFSIKILILLLSFVMTNSLINSRKLFGSRILETLLHRIRLICSHHV